MKTKFFYLFLGCMFILSACKKDSAPEPETVDCNGIENGTSILDDCGDCQQAYLYTMSTHEVQLLDDTAGVLVAPGQMLVMPADPSNPYWNAGCIVAPTTYEFMYQGQSTVTYSGQTTRLMMAKELTDALKNGTHSLSQLQDMWSAGTGFSGNLDNPEKILRSKTSASATASATVQVQLDELLVNYSDEVLNNWNGNAEIGVPGEFTDANRTVHINAKGMEIDQCFAKALIGALCYDQTVNKYCEASYQAGLNNVDRDPAEDNNATQMEHKWDEGYGYIYGMIGENTTGDLSTDNLLGKYLNKFSEKIPVVFDAFKLGRAAIVGQDYDLRDSQTDILKSELANVIAAKTIGYLEGAAGELVDSDGNTVAPGADYFHDLSEGWGFILSLQYTDWYTNTEVNTMLDALEAGNGFWDRGHDELMDMASEIRSRTGIQ